MSEGMDTKVGRRPWSETRLGRVSLFLAIVWSIAGAFQVLETGVPNLLNQAVRAGWVPPERVMSEPMRTAADADCAGPPAGVTQSGGQRSLDAAQLRLARYAAWQMGNSFGMAAAAGQAGLSPDQLAPHLAAVRGHAIALGVPPPQLPRIQHVANALSEFANDLDSDPQCIAARLASRYTPLHGHTYRFGVAVGYAAVYCVKGACGTFASQIRRYGQLAGIPEQLWLPMMQDALASAPDANGPGQMGRVLGRLDEHVKAAP